MVVVVVVVVLVVVRVVLVVVVVAVAVVVVVRVVLVVVVVAVVVRVVLVASAVVVVVVVVVAVAAAVRDGSTEGSVGCSKLKLHSVEAFLKIVMDESKLFYVVNDGTASVSDRSRRILVTGGGEMILRFL